MSTSRNGSAGSGAEDAMTARTQVWGSKTRGLKGRTLTATGKPLSEEARQAMPWLLTADERRARFRETMHSMRVSDRLGR